ncbi:MAG: type II toxin-antitoxin system HicB family antitoxin [Deltaproteobacteria bacterium]|nr:type II toxin-antitoxin system HicB family antitoxin [Deltaproteobacteria bacterium]
MIIDYVTEALRRAHYQLADGEYCGTVAALPGVISTGVTLEACRDQLAEVVEGWVLVRVARGLPVPRLGRRTVVVKKAG